LFDDVLCNLLVDMPVFEIHQPEKAEAQHEIRHEMAFSQ
jgi:hypothetical protein